MSLRIALILSLLTFASAAFAQTIPAPDDCLKKLGVQEGQMPTIEQLQQCAPKPPTETLSAPSAPTSPTTVSTTQTASQSSATCPNLTRTLQKGSRGTDVTQLQSFLIQKGYLASDSATGYFGSLTEAAVQKFQCAQSVVCSGNPSSTGYGLVGAKTRAAIQRSCSGTTTTTTTNTTSSNTSNSSQSLIDQLNAQIKQLQERLAALGNTNSTQTSQSTQTTQSTQSTQTTQTTQTTTNTSCSFNNQTVAHGASVTAYQSSSVASGQTCQSQTRTCSNGTLSGTYTAATCSVQSAPAQTTLTSAESAFVNRWLASLDSWHASIFNQSRYDWGNHLGWSIGYIMDDALDIYERTKDPRFLDAVVKYADAAFEKRESVLNQTKGQCKVGDTYENAPIWVMYNYAGNAGYKISCYVSSSVHTGMILGPIARFVRIVENGSLSSYSGKAATYEGYIKQALEYHENTDKSIYIYDYAGDGLRYAFNRMCVGCTADQIEEKRIGAQAPVNMIAALGRVYAELSYKSSFYSDRATYFARTVKDLIQRTGSGYTWYYWPAYESRMDDSSHGAIVADAVARMKERGVVFTQTDLDKIAYNFITNTVKYGSGGTAQGIATYIDGSMADNQYQNSVCGWWMQLGDYNGKLYNACKQLCGWNAGTLSCDSDTYTYKRTEAQLFRVTK